MDYLKLKSPCLNTTDKEDEEMREARNETKETPGQATANPKTPSAASAVRAGGRAIVNDIKTAEKSWRKPRITLP